MPFFNVVQTISKNERSKRGNLELANTCIASALMGMDAWITKGNWKNGFGSMFLGFRDAMQKYYLRLTGQVERQIQVHKSATPLRTGENALQLYIKDQRMADRAIPLALQALNIKLEIVAEYVMIDVNDYMPDMSRMQ